MVMLKRISILLILLAGILKAQTPNNFYYDWKRGAVFSDVNVKDSIKLDSAGILSIGDMKQMDGIDRSYYIVNKPQVISSIFGSNRTNYIFGYNNFSNAEIGAGSKENYVYGNNNFDSISVPNNDSSAKYITPYAINTTVVNGNRSNGAFGHGNLRELQNGGSNFVFGRASFQNLKYGGNNVGMGTYNLATIKYGTSNIAVGGLGNGYLTLDDSLHTAHRSIYLGSYQFAYSNNTEYHVGVGIYGSLIDNREFDVFTDKASTGEDSLSGFVALCDGLGGKKLLAGQKLTRLYAADNLALEIDSLNRYQFTGNAKDANGTALTNGQTLISDGTKMIGKDVETYVRDSVVDFIKVTTASSSPGTAVAVGGDITLNYTVTGVTELDNIQVTPTEAYGSSSVFLPYVAYYSSVNQVSVRLYNPFSTTITPADIQFYILVTKAK